jgi:hypothetical protein
MGGWGGLIKIFNLHGTCRKPPGYLLFETILFLHKSVGTGHCHVNALHIAAV